MTDNEKRAHEIALFAAQTKVMALLDESNKNHRLLSYNFYSLYQEAYASALTQLEIDYPEKNN